METVPFRKISTPGDQVKLRYFLQWLNKAIHRADRKMMAVSFNKFYGKMWHGFFLNLESASSQRFYFILCSSKKTVLGIFKIPLRLRDRHGFMWQSMKILSVNKSSEKTRVLVQSTTNESATFPYITALSKANVEKNWMGNTKWTITKNGLLPLTASFFWKLNLNIRTS